MMKIKPINRKYEKEVMQVFKANQAYFEIVEGKMPDQSSLEEFFTDIPPGKSLSDKSLFGIFEANQLIGVLDLLKNYPDQQTWFLGLLMLSDHKGKGIGRAVVQFACKEAAQYGAKYLRIGVIEDNVDAMGFWRAMGFVMVKTTQPMQFGQKWSRVHVLMKKVRD